MKRAMKHFFLPVAVCLSLAAASASAGDAKGFDAFVGLPPSKLLKQAPAFATAYRAAIKDQDLPAWTERLSVGFPATAVKVDGRDQLLISACNPDSGCRDERFYLLYDPAAGTLTGLFFLPPNLDDPGDHRMAFSRWLGSKPTKENSNFLLNRALEDAEKPDDPANRPTTVQAAH